MCHHEHRIFFSNLQHFVKPEDASAALNALDDSEFQGAHIQVQVISLPHCPPSSCSLVSDRL